ncbi:MAG TPA: hypothetical protein VH063_14140 [Gaiellaceae bacterium]|jgi:hypothetical protein|nr:hypothetical protein [Gaiellaceae bacterium]
MSARRIRLVVLALMALGAVDASGPSAAATLPSIYVQYADDCSVGISVDGGTILEPSATPAVIPPGSYQIVLRAPENSAACAISFQLTGPGVQLLFDFGGEGLNDQATETLLPGSTYLAVDLNEAARTRAVFSTSATGSSSTLVKQPQTTATGHGQVATDVVGSAVLAYRGGLRATIGTTGPLVLRAHGRAVTSIRAGRYDLAVLDRTARSGLMVGKLHGRAVALTGAAFVGTRTERVALTAGTWVLSSSGARALRIVVYA